MPGSPHCPTNINQNHSGQGFILQFCACSKNCAYKAIRRTFFSHLCIWVLFQFLRGRGLIRLERNEAGPRISLHVTPLWSCIILFQSSCYFISMYFRAISKISLQEHLPHLSVSSHLESFISRITNISLNTIHTLPMPNSVQCSTALQKHHSDGCRGTVQGRADCRLIQPCWDMRTSCRITKTQ